MVIKYAIFDWNGTLFEPPTDEELNKAIAYARLDDAVSGIKHGKLWRAWDVGKLLVAKKQLRKRLAEYKAGERQLAEVYEPFNRLVVNGMPTGLFWDAVRDYAKENRSMMDKRMMIPIEEARLEKVGILSVSQEYAIRCIIHDLYSISPFNDIVANTAIEDGDVMRGVTLDIYGKKGEVFEDEFLRKRGFVAESAVYAGDTEDDLPVAKMLPRGHFVVPFYASNAFREKAARVYGAFVPEDQADWADFLAKK
jgi:phosphoserine phosphatase